jgi:hypothetical protein
MNQARRRQRIGFPSGISPQVSSKRERATNLLGGGERGCRGECFAQGGGGEARRGRPESPGDGGGDLGIASELEGRERSVRGLGWVG